MSEAEKDLLSSAKLLSAELSEAEAQAELVEPNAPYAMSVREGLLRATGEWFSRTECRAATSPDFRHTASFHSSTLV